MEGRTPSLIWVCDCCLQHLANGECGECDTGHDRTPLGLLSDDAEPTLGMMWDEHHEDCDFRNSRSAQETSDALGLGEDHSGYDCNLDCETRDFSWSACPACGSTLGGSRGAVTLWGKD